MSEREHYHRRDRRQAIDTDMDERIDLSETLMKTYPNIAYATESNLPIFAFDKLDGSNVRAEWSKKKGWYKFGTRNRLVDSSDPLFGKVPGLITNKYGEDLPRVFAENGWDKTTCFFEFWGPNSAFGQHDLSEEQMVTLFDVAPFGEGILGPKMFITSFGDLDIAKILYSGAVTPEFIEMVRRSTLPGMTFEGVVCKTENDKKTKMPIFFKQKSSAWLDKLHAYCGNNQNLLNSLI